MENIKNAKNYINDLIDNVLNLGLDLDGYYVDHVAFRSGGEGGNFQRYIELKNIIIDYGSVLIAEEIIPPNVNGRPIAIFKLSQKIDTKLGEVNYIELPAPRFGKNEIEGFTHIEIVLPNGVTLQKFFEKNKPNLLSKVNLTDVEEQINQESLNKPNCEIELDFGDNQKVKFHRTPIWEVIEEERKDNKQKLDNLKSEFASNYPSVIS